MRQACHSGNRRRPVALFVALAALIVGGVIYRHEIAASVRAFDGWCCRQAGREAWGRWVKREDWSSVPPASGYDFGWLDKPYPLRIAHALGESKSAGQNSLSAAESSIAAGFVLLEVDVWRDAQGRLWCRHGADPSDESNEHVGARECELAELLSLIRRRPGVRLVPDIKSDFESTAVALILSAASQGLADRLVMQLYEPDHLRLFEAWHRRWPLPGPIVTTYRARRPIWRIEQAIQSLGYRAIALPYDDLAFVDPPPEGFHLLIHPVHDCARQRELLRQGLDIGFTLHALKCP